ncbi:MAG: 3-dehydroquinate synthase [Planctomycetota bacterium]|nr:MAG: 3-dehydroquinate synthase [Planctomycetota bacterium]
MSVTQVQVRLGSRSYAIEIGSGVLADGGRFVCSRGGVRHAVVVADENVESPHAMAVAESLAREDARVDLVVVEAGEGSKSVDMAAGLWQKLLDLGADRTTAVVAVGGGVIGDLSGFVAATYARGLDFFQIPTTLLAQVDSSVGGKVGINLPAAKNMVGAFWQPRGVLVDVATLGTLPDREYRSGLAEVVKYGVILDAELFGFLEASVAELNARDGETLIRTIERCCRLKADVVEQDERETSGLRAVLNYGHTFAHALEAVAGYGELLHGEAVAIGMECAARLAHGLGRIDDSFVERQRNLLRALRLPIAVPALGEDRLIAAMASDKKVAHGRLRFVLPTKLGHVELVSGVDERAVRGALVEE